MTTIAAAFLAALGTTTHGTLGQFPAGRITNIQGSLAAGFQVAPAVAEPTRLEITPAMRGRIEDEEWDPFSTDANSKSFFQWQPGAIFVAASGPAGSDLLVSLDLDNDGWLVGSDNIEVRVSVEGGGPPIVRVRQLNARNVAGPTWVDLPGWALASTAKATVDGGRVSYELQLTDAGIGVLPTKPQKIGARVDLVSSGETTIPANQPRVLAPINLASSRAEGMPSNLHYQVERAEEVIPGSSSFMRFDFSESKLQQQPLAKKINISGEGLMKTRLSELTAPFPNLAPKNRGFVDFSSRVSPDAEPGYHIVKAVITLADDTPATVEKSFYIAPPLEVALEHTRVNESSRDRSVAVDVSLMCNLQKSPMAGEIRYSVDPKFKVLNQASDKIKFVIGPKERLTKRFAILVPANVKGTYPITFDVDSKGLKSRVVRFFTIG